MLSDTMSSDKLLIIEDTKTMALLYSKYLSSEGREADIADTGKKGLDLIEFHNYAAIILDLNLPDMNGLDILRHIQMIKPTIPIIVVTAYGSVGAAADAMKLGAFDFIMKPFASARLNATVKVAVDYAKIKNELQTLKDNMFDALKSMAGISSPTPNS
jgi:two-component system, repressor protein LuxO